MTTPSFKSLEQLSLPRFVQSVRRWFPIPVAMAVIGVLLGALAGASVRPSAEALVNVTAGSLDATTMARIMETTVQQVRAPAVFEGAAASLGDGIGPDDLRDRTRISAVATSQVLAVQVVAATPEEATRQADAVVSSALAQQQSVRSVGLERVTEAIRDLMDSANSQVKDRNAEQARLTRLGAALADIQATVATGEVNLESLQSARPARLSTGAFTLALFCGLGAGLLGLAIALLLGNRRGGVRDLQELAQFYPQVPVIDRRDLTDVLAVEGGRIKSVIVAGVRCDRDRLVALREEVAAQLAANTPTGGQTVLASELNDTVLRRVTTDPSTLVLVVVDPAMLQLEWLGRRLEELTSRAYLMELSTWPT